MTEANPVKLRQIRSLLDLAEHASTPTSEREQAMATAMRLMALYGIERAHLSARGAVADPIDITEVELGTAYTKGKAHLLHRISSPLHCKSIRIIARNQAKVLGAASDRERVIMLYTSLLIQFSIEASKIKGGNAGTTRSMRDGFFRGYANVVGDRLAEHENWAIAESGDSTGTALVLSDRSSSVKARFTELFPDSTKDKKRLFNHRGYTMGQEAGEHADIGITRVGERRNALPSGR